MQVADAFPSKFLKASDLQGKTVIATITLVEYELIGKDSKEGKKFILSFQGKEKKMVVNKTNAQTIAKLYGDDTDAWIGKAIKLLSREVEFQGDVVLALRVSLEKPGQKTPEPKTDPHRSEESDRFDANPMDETDSVPF